MRSEEQKQASRNNGAKSNGPKTEQGKERSSQNGMRHNLASGHLVLLSTEDPYSVFKTAAFVRSATPPTGGW